jgi:hypothetical protein
MKDVLLLVLFWFLCIAGLAAIAPYLGGCGGPPPRVVHPSAVDRTFRVCVTLVSVDQRQRDLCSKSRGECEQDRRSAVQYASRVGISGISECRTLAVVPVEKA